MAKFLLAAMFFVGAGLGAQTLPMPEPASAPATLSPLAKNLWNLLLSPETQFSGALALFERPSLGLVDAEVLDEVSADPAGRRYIEFGRRYFDDYVREISEKLKAHQLQDYNFEFAPEREVTEAADAFTAEDGAAEDGSDFRQRLTAWTDAQKKRVQETDERNVKEALRVMAVYFPGSMLKRRAEPHHVIAGQKLPEDSAITAQELNELRVENVPSFLASQIGTVKGEGWIPSWFLVNAEGERWAVIDWFHFLSYFRTRDYHRVHEAAAFEPYWIADEIPRQVKWLGRPDLHVPYLALTYFLDAHRKSSALRHSTLTRVGAAQNPADLRKIVSDEVAVMAADASLVRSNIGKLHSNNPDLYAISVELSVLSDIKWWGVARDALYWERREAEATQTYLSEPRLQAYFPVRFLRDIGVARWAGVCQRILRRKV